MANWYYTRDNKKMGPVSAGQLKQLTTAGQLRPTDLVWQEGFAQWLPAGSVKEFFPRVVDGRRPSPPPLPSQLRFRCPRCGTVYDRPEKFAGEILSCPSCHVRIEIPKPAGKVALMGEIVETTPSLQSPARGETRTVGQLPKAWAEFLQPLAGGNVDSPLAQLLMIVLLIITVIGGFGLALAIVLTHK